MFNFAQVAWERSPTTGFHPHWTSRENSLEPHLQLIELSRFNKVSLI